MQTSDAPKRSFALLAWIVILLVCGLKLSEVVINTLGLVDAEDDLPTDGLVVSINEELMGKIVVGGVRIAPEAGPIFLSKIEPMKKGGWGERFAYVILVGEIEGADAALALMDEEKLLEVKEDEQPENVDSLIQTMRLLLGDRVEGNVGLPSLDEPRREELLERSGWIGRLALLAPDTDDQAGREALIKPLLIILIVMGIVLGTMGLFALAGLIGLVVFIIFAFKGKIRHGFQTSGSRGGLYAETFALWVLFFFGSQYLIGLALEADMLASELSTPLVLLLFFLSLIIMAWPVVRGVSFQQVRQDIGWTTGRGVFRELFGVGFAGYAMALPILGVGVGLTLILLMIQEYLLPDAPPTTHPIQDMAGSGDLLIIVQMYILGSIAAPIVEETFFRGVLYRHFRESSRKWSLLLSVFASALASSLIFAGLHPQGLAVIPALASLGVAFCLIREWRGSLLAPMFVHGFSNFLVISLNLALFGAG